MSDTQSIQAPQHNPDVLTTKKKANAVLNIGSFVLLFIVLGIMIYFLVAEHIANNQALEQPEANIQLAFKQYRNTVQSPLINQPAYEFRGDTATILLLEKRHRSNSDDTYWQLIAQTPSGRFYEAEYVLYWNARLEAKGPDRFVAIRSGALDRADAQREMAVAWRGQPLKFKNTFGVDLPPPPAPPQPF